MTPAPQSNKIKPWVWIVVAVVVLAIVVTVIYVATKQSQPPTPPPTTQSSTSNKPTTSPTSSKPTASSAPTTQTNTMTFIYSALPGECFDRQTMKDDSYIFIRPLDCYTPHDSEILFVGDVNATAYPGDDGWSDYVGELCLPAFRDYVGISYSISNLNIAYVTPGESGWNIGNHTLICYVYDETGPVSTPLQGSAR